MGKKELKKQIKKDKARLKELRKLDKQNALSEDETWEYVRLLNEDTERVWELNEKLSWISVGMSVLSLILAIIACIVRLSK